MDRFRPVALERVLRGALALLILGCGAAAAIAEEPEEYAGLTAWYRIDTLHRNHNDGELVLEWPDSSGKGHRLVAHADGVPAIFQTRQVNLEPVVQIRANTAFEVERPFELQDHTIFLVYETSLTRRALFYDDTDDHRGLILFNAQRYHQYVSEDPEKTVSYSGKAAPRRGFSITVLARGHGILSCRVNGVDLSSGAGFEPVIRVGGFFFVRPMVGGRGDADGMRVAEMIFYDRQLNDEEIAGVTAYLSSKYAIDVAEPEPAPGIVEPPAALARDFLPALEEARVWLGTRTEADVNPRAFVVPWQSRLKLDSPFRHDPAEETDTRLVCTRDGTRVELFVRLPLRTVAEDARVQLLILKNGEEYLDEYGDSGPITGSNPKWATIDFKTTLELNAGDYIEIVVRGIGERGYVSIQPHHAALVALTD